ncbi:hypothetical protein NEOLEDRAFT_10500 [Neolentinus lepideus HHB14362 ss-1]|uniref:Uncharacterized protein n=1 Tax=Neolentinus lepideus HHB14362 ss-1 TaxID=1314782 RepID=A0A165W008_9AGAM|nr:hypothetical protein NEOLEDRAFT_10500 [Neolentinus lepideus HHB14362 ss-1]
MPSGTSQLMPEAMTSVLGEKVTTAPTTESLLRRGNTKSALLHPTEIRSTVQKASSARASSSVADGQPKATVTLPHPKSVARGQVPDVCQQPSLATEAKGSTSPALAQRQMEAVSAEMNKSVLRRSQLSSASDRATVTPQMRLAAGTLNHATHVPLFALASRATPIQSGLPYPLVLSSSQKPIASVRNNSLKKMSVDDIDVIMADATALDSDAMDIDMVQSSVEIQAWVEGDYPMGETVDETMCDLDALPEPTDSEAQKTEPIKQDDRSQVPITTRPAASSKSQQKEAQTDAAHPLASTSPGAALSTGLQGGVAGPQIAIESAAPTSSSVPASHTEPKEDLAAREGAGRVQTVTFSAAPVRAERDEDQPQATISAAPSPSVSVLHESGQQNVVGGVQATSNPGVPSLAAESKVDVPERKDHVTTFQFPVEISSAPDLQSISSASSETAPIVRLPTGRIQSSPAPVSQKKPSPTQESAPRTRVPIVPPPSSSTSESPPVASASDSVGELPKVPVLATACSASTSEVVPSSSPDPASIPLPANAVTPSAALEPSMLSVSATSLSSSSTVMPSNLLDPVSNLLAVHLQGYSSALVPPVSQASVDQTATSSWPLPVVPSIPPDPAPTLLSASPLTPSLAPELGHDSSLARNCVDPIREPISRPSLSVSPPPSQDRSSIALDVAKDAESQGRGPTNQALSPSALDFLDSASLTGGRLGNGTEQLHVLSGPAASPAVSSPPPEPEEVAENRVGPIHKPTHGPVSSSAPQLQDNTSTVIDAVPDADLEQLLAEPFVSSSVPESMDCSFPADQVPEDTVEPLWDPLGLGTATIEGMDAPTIARDSAVVGNAAEQLQGRSDQVISPSGPGQQKFHLVFDELAASQPWVLQPIIASGGQSSSTTSSELAKAVQNKYSPGMTAPSAASGGANSVANTGSSIWRGKQKALDPFEEVDWGLSDEEYEQPMMAESSLDTVGDINECGARGEVVRQMAGQASPRPSAPPEPTSTPQVTPFSERYPSKKEVTREVDQFGTLQVFASQDDQAGLRVTPITIGMNEASGLRTAYPATDHKMQYVFQHSQVPTSYDGLGDFSSSAQSSSQVGHHTAEMNLNTSSIDDSVIDPQLRNMSAGPGWISCVSQQTVMASDNSAYQEFLAGDERSLICGYQGYSNGVSGQGNSGAPPQELEDSWQAREADREGGHSSPYTSVAMEGNPGSIIGEGEGASMSMSTPGPSHRQGLFGDIFTPPLDEKLARPRRPLPKRTQKPEPTDSDAKAKVKAKAELRRSAHEWAKELDPL